MNPPFGFDLGWLAVSVASGLVIGATVSWAPPAPPVQGPGEASTSGVEVSFLLGAPAATATAGIPPDPFRGVGSSAGATRDESMPIETYPPSSAIVLPRVVGVGRRSDGVSFVGCDTSSGQGIVIVREGGLCGSARLIGVSGDSARFAIEPLDSVLTVGIGGG